MIDEVCDYCGEEDCICYDECDYNDDYYDSDLYLDEDIDYYDYDEVGDEDEDY